MRASPSTGRVFSQPPDFSVAEIPEDVHTYQGWDSTPVIHIASDDGFTLAVVIFRDGKEEAGHVAAAGRIETMRSLHDVPSEISAALDDVHFFKVVLTDVANNQSVGGDIKRETPWIAKPVRPDLRQSAATRKGTRVDLDVV